MIVGLGALIGIALLLCVSCTRDDKTGVTRDSREHQVNSASCCVEDEMVCLHVATGTTSAPQGQEEQPLGQLPPHVSLPDAAAGWGDGAEEGEGRRHTSAEKPRSCSTIGGKALVQTEGFGFWWVLTSPR